MADQNLTLKIKVGVDGQPQVELLNQSLGKVKTTASSMGSGLTSLGTAVKGFVAAFAVHEIVSFSKELINMGDEMIKASRKSGIAFEQLAKLKEGANLAGVGFESLQVGLKKLNVNLVAAENGNKPLLAAFNNLGISAKELKSLGPDKVLEKIADAFSKSKDSSEKAALAVQIFGRSGTELIPFLNEGSEGLNKFSSAIDENFARRAEAFNDKLKIMKIGLEGLGKGIVEPFLGPVATGFQFLSYWVDNLKTGFVELSILGRAFGTVLKGAFTLQDPKEVYNRVQEIRKELVTTQNEYLKRNADFFKKIATTGQPGVAKLGDLSTKGTQGDDGAKKIASETDSLNDYITKQKESIALLVLEGQKVQISDIENKKRSETIKHNAEAERDASKYTGSRLATYKKESEAFLKRKLELIQENEEQKRTFKYGAQEAFQEYVRNATNSAALVKNAFSNVFQNLEDSLMHFIETGKFNFKEFATFILREIERIAIKQAVLAPIIGAIGGVIGGLVGGGDSGSSSASSSSSSFGSGPTLGNGNYSFQANGGIVGSQGEMALNYYARGGIANSPQMAIFGEGASPEAYVPLPDGRRIPVALQGNGGAGGGTNVTVNVNVESGKEGNVSDSKNASKLGQAISNAVKKQLVLEKRSGGLLA